MGAMVPRRRSDSVAVRRWGSDVTGTDVVAFGATPVLFALVSDRLRRWWITMPMVCVASGAALELTGTVDLAVAIDEVAILAEVTLAVILFGDAVRMDARTLRRRAELPMRLLLIGLPLSIALGTFLAWWLLPGVSLAAAGLVASILAPTDAALGEAVVSDRSVPIRIRDALNVEAGLNDGLAVPAVVLFLELTEGDTRTWSDWLEFVARQIGGGLLLGVAVGGAGGWMLGRARARAWMEGLFAQLALLGLAVLTFTAAIELGVNAFVAAFVAGLAAGTVLDEVAEHLDDYTTDSGSLLAAVAFFVFGNLFVADALGTIDAAVIVCAVATLTVGRLVPVVAATALMGLRRPTIAFLGWFGPRGLASIVFGVVVLEAELDVGDELFDVIALTVLLSVFAHGLSATPGAARYGAWYSRVKRDEMAEAAPAMERRLRRTMER